MLLVLSPVNVISREEDWIAVKRADADDTVHVTLALKQLNTEWLDDTLVAVSDPNSPRYGNYMSLADIVQHVHADERGVNAVMEYFRAYDLTPRFTMGNGFAVLDIPVSTAEELFSARFYKYHHQSDPTLSTIRTLTYALPDPIASHLEFTCCIDQLPHPNTIGPLRSYNANGLSVTPSDIRSSYEINDYVAKNSTTSQGIAAFLKQYFNPSDLEKFQKKFDIPSNPIAKVIGKNTHLLAGAEASLDVEYITGRCFISIFTTHE